MNIVLQCPLCTSVDQDKVYYSNDLDKMGERLITLHILTCSDCDTCITREGGTEHAFKIDCAYKLPPRDDAGFDSNFN